MGEVLGPLVDGPRDREMRAHLGEVEADDQLSDDDDGPAPEERRAGQADTQDEKGEDSSRRRDVGEGDRKAGVDPQHPPQLLLVAEPREVSNVGTVSMVLQVVPLPRLAPPRNVCYRSWGEPITWSGLRQCRLLSRPPPPPSPAGAAEGDTCCPDLHPPGREKSHLDDWANLPGSNLRHPAFRRVLDGFVQVPGFDHVE